MDKFATCYGCPDRSLSCRANCDGWKKREADKAARYERNRIHSANYNTYNPQKERLLKKKGIPLKGYGG